MLFLFLFNVALAQNLETTVPAPIQPQELPEESAKIKHQMWLSLKTLGVHNEGLNNFKNLDVRVFNNINTKESVVFINPETNNPNVGYLPANLSGNRKTLIVNKATYRKSYWKHLILNSVYRDQVTQ